MLNFNVDRDLCTACGECAADCPVRIIKLDGGVPRIPAEEEEKCYACGHCFAVCPAGALSIHGLRPEAETPLVSANLPTPDALETLIRGRRSVRRYRDENLPTALVERLVAVASHAPTGVNARRVRFALIDDRSALAAFRAETYAALGRALASGAHAAHPRAERFAKVLEVWREKGVDILFRGAPHFIVATAPADAPTPEADCLIALSYFELYARTLGVGTVWDGMMRWVMVDFAPELKAPLGIPGDHLFGYAMAFGPPAVTHRRTLRRAPFETYRLA